MHNVSPMQVESSVSKVLADMKQKYDAANKRSAQARSQQNKSKSDLDMIKQVQKAKLDEIKKLCRFATGSNAPDVRPAFCSIEQDLHIVCQ